MLFYKSLILSLFSLTFVAVRSQDDEIFSNLLDGGLNPMQNYKAEFCYKFCHNFAEMFPVCIKICLDVMENMTQAVTPEKVDIKLYYECFCPGCKMFDVYDLRPTVEKLASYLNVQLYPYGNAQTIDKGNGQYEFKCQHGPNECYGNKLHACAIDYLGNITKAVFFNSCMMESSRADGGSNDQAADECGKRMNVDPERIKQCAKGDRGNQLLKYYGDETNKVNHQYVPWVMINGVLVEISNNFFGQVCAAFNTPPPECAHLV